MEVDCNDVDKCNLWYQWCQQNTAVAAIADCAADTPCNTSSISNEIKGVKATVDTLAAQLSEHKKTGKMETVEVETGQRVKHEPRKEI